MLKLLGLKVGLWILPTNLVLILTADTLVNFSEMLYWISLISKLLSKRSLKIKRNYAPASFELGIAELNMCNKLAAKEAFNIAKRDRNYRKAAGEYLKQENFEYYTKDCN